MPNIRIKDIPTTASATSSTDFIGIDGSANGTRKLDAFSPTFGGNLTVSGTGTSSVAGKLAVGTTAVIGNAQFTLKKATNKNLNIDAAAGAVSGISIYAGTDADAYTGLQVDGDKLYLNARSGGNVLIGTTTDNSATFAANRTGTGPASSGAISTAAIRAVDVSNDLALDIGVNSAASPYPGWIQVHGRTNQATNYPLALNPNGGNVLVGTTTDGGQKLQVSGSRFISGSLAVGDRAAPAGVSLRVQQAGSDDVGLEWQRTSATNGILLSYNRASSAYTSMSYGASSHTFTISGTTALTLDSSANATFAGTDVTVNGGSTSSNLTLKRASNSFGAVVNYNTTTTNKWFHGLRGLTNDNWYLFNNVAGNSALIFDAATSDATFAGRVRAASGSGSSVSFGFSSEVNTGLYLPYANWAQFVVGGNSVCAFLNSYNGATGGMVLVNNLTVAPTSNPAGGGFLYCEGGALKYRGSSGTVTTIANA